MSEDEWQVATDPLEMLAFLHAAADSRKILLLNQACIRRVENAVSKQCLAWGERAGQIADEGTPPDELHNDWESVESELNSLDMEESSPNGGGRFYALLNILVVAWDDPTAWEAGNAAWAHETKVHAAIIRDIFGNPFCSATFSPQWRTSTVMSLARQMYESRDFSAMPILADALQEAGCNDDDILKHCRQPDEHVRGCWVVDLVLGKQ